MLVQPFRNAARGDDCHSAWEEVSPSPPNHYFLHRYGANWARSYRDDGKGDDTSTVTAHTISQALAVGALLDNRAGYASTPFG